MRVALCEFFASYPICAFCNRITSYFFYRKSFI